MTRSTLVGSTYDGGGHLASGARALHNNQHRRCLPGNHIGRHCLRCDHLTVNQVAIPWDSPTCPSSCWDSFTSEDRDSIYAEDELYDD